MSLQFIFGNSGSGKSYYLFEHIIAESIKFPEKNYIVLVPEQFTLQTQKEFVARHPKHGIMNIDVLSFARLAFRVLEETGDNQRQILDDEGKNLILRKIAKKIEPSLHVLKGNLKKPGYISEVKSVISELTQYNISPTEMDEMKNVAEEHSYLYYKLQDIQLIYQAFEQYLADKYITKEEILDLLCAKMETSRMMKDCVMVLDGFTGFTPVQNKVIRKMLSICSDVMVTVTMDKRENPFVLEDKFHLFAMSKQMVTSLVKIANEEKVEIKKSVELYQEPVYRFRNTPALAFLEQELFRAKGKVYEKKQTNIRLYSVRNPKEEVNYVAQKIRSLVRARGYKYSDIAVIASDMKIYGDEIERVFEDYKIPIFMDYKRSILLNPFVEYIRSLLSMAEKNFTGESVIRFLRTDLTGFTQTEIDLLENYLRALGIRGYKKWQEKWIRRGKTTSEEELELLNHLRVKFVEMIDEMTLVLKQKQKSVRDISEALYYFFVREEIPKKLKEQELTFAESGNLALAKEYAQIYRVVMELLDKFVLLLGEEQISVREYAELLEAGMEEARIGVVPPGVDEVVVGDIERTRLKDVKALLLIGANDTLIPGNVLKGGLLNERERTTFEEQGIALAPGAKEKTYIQKFYLYLHMTKPTEELCLSCSRVSAEGKSLRPSYLMGEIKRLYPNISIFDMEQYGAEVLELTADSAKQYLIKGLRNPEEMKKDSWKTLYRWYMNQPEWRPGIERLVCASMYHKSEDSITRRTAEKLFGVRDASVSRLERFAACAMAHFLTYGLNLKEREEYEFAALDFGNIFHTALEKYSKRVAEAGVDWCALEENVRTQWVEEAIEESIIDYNNTLLYSTARNSYMIPRMKRMMKRTIWALTKQLEHGEFRPAEYEISFGSGKIDRIDICHSKDDVYVKILDYKTGNKEFDMVAFYHGLQMQLVVYMQEALKLEQKKHPGKNIVPAGIFYYHLKDPVVDKMPDKQALEEAILKRLCVDGIINGTEDIISKMDKYFEKSSNVIPVSKTKSGYSKASKILAEEEFQEVLEYAGNRRKELQEEMQSGLVDARPYQMGSQTGCDYCGYRSICGFDQEIDGYEYQKLKQMSREDVMAAIIRDNKKGEEEKSCQ